MASFSSLSLSDPHAMWGELLHTGSMNWHSCAKRGSQRKLYLRPVLDPLAKPRRRGKGGQAGPVKLSSWDGCPTDRRHREASWPHPPGWGFSAIFPGAFLFPVIQGSSQISGGQILVTEAVVIGQDPRTSILRVGHLRQTCPRW